MSRLTGVGRGRRARPSSSSSSRGPRGATTTGRSSSPAPSRRPRPRKSAGGARQSGAPTPAAGVNAIGQPAEAAWHHPDLTGSDAFVKVKLLNHATNGVTDKDFELARKMDEVIMWRPGARRGKSSPPERCPPRPTRHQRLQRRVAVAVALRPGMARRCRKRVEPATEGESAPCAAPCAGAKPVPTRHNGPTRAPIPALQATSGCRGLIPRARLRPCRGRLKFLCAARVAALPKFWR